MRRDPQRLALKNPRLNWAKQFKVRSRHRRESIVRIIRWNVGLISNDASRTIGYEKSDPIGCTQVYRTGSCRSPFGGFLIALTSNPNVSPGQMPLHDLAARWIGYDRFVYTFGGISDRFKRKPQRFPWSDTAARSGSKIRLTSNHHQEWPHYATSRRLDSCPVEDQRWKKVEAAFTGTYWMRLHFVCPRNFHTP